MKDIVIYGAGGLGREILWLIENINAKSPAWKVIGFVDDGECPEMCGKDFNGYRVLGGFDWLKKYPGEIYVTCAIGKSRVRKAVYEKVALLPNVKIATLIDPLVRVDKTVNIGAGTTICCNCVVTVNINIGKGVLMNTGSSVGHDASVGDYCTFYTNSMAAGNTTFGECCEIGSGAFILQGKTVTANTVIAPISSVLSDITESGTYMGNPARRMR